MITLINCKAKLEVMGIYMEQTGSGAILGEKLSERLVWTWWGYYFEDERLEIGIEDGTEIPNMSDFGELVTDDSYKG
jgi:hypothetical protein